MASDERPDSRFRFSSYYARNPIIVNLRGRSWPVHYLEFGDRGKPLIILWHGVGSRAGQFFEYSHIMQDLVSQGFYVVAPDLPGHGRTVASQHPDDFKIAALAELMADFTAKVIHESESPSCVWVAHSLSAGALLFWLASRGRKPADDLAKLQGAVLISLPVAKSTPLLLTGAALPAASEILPELLYRVGRPYFSLYLRTINRQPGLHRAFLELYMPESAASVRAHIRFIRENLHLLTNPRAVFSSFAVKPATLPVVFLHGKDDLFFPVDLVKGLVNEYLPKSRFIIKAHGGHNLPDDLPEEVVYEIVEFSKSI